MPKTTEILGDGGDAIRVLSGDCTVVADGDRREERRSLVTVIMKPDETTARSFERVHGSVSSASSC